MCVALKKNQQQQTTKNNKQTTTHKIGVYMCLYGFNMFLYMCLIRFSRLGSATLRFFFRLAPEAPMQLIICHGTVSYETKQQQTNTIQSRTMIRHY